MLRTSTQAPIRPPTITVAAADSSARAKRAADRVCSGSDDQETIADAIAMLPAGGGTVEIADGSYSFSDHVHVTSDNVTLRFGKHSLLTAVPGGFTGVDYDDEWSITKQFVYLDGCTNSNVIGGDFDGSAFDTHVTGESAAAIFGRAVTNCVVEGVSVHDFNPSVVGQDEFRGWNDGGRKVRYRGVFFWNSSNVTITRSTGRNVKYNIFGFHGTTSSSRMTENSSEMCLENHQVGNNTSYCVVAHNACRLWVAAAIVTHGNYIVFSDNTISPPYLGPQGLSSTSSALAVLGTVNAIVSNNTANLDGLNNGIRVQGSYSLIQGNSIHDPVHGIEVIGSSFGGVISGNLIRACMGNGIQQASDSSISFFAITGNTIVISASAGASSRIGINVLLDRAVIAGNSVHCTNTLPQGIVLNAIAGTVIGVFSGNRIWAANRVVGWNRNVATSANQNFQISRSGTATVTNGNTSIVVTHGLAATPEIRDIQITPTNGLGNAAKFWISNPTSTQFTINVDADPGATTATFAWSAEIKP